MKFGDKRIITLCHFKSLSNSKVIIFMKRARYESWKSENQTWSGTDKSQNYFESKLMWKVEKLIIKNLNKEIQKTRTRG